MAYKYSKITVKDVGRGIDARSAESAVPQGYAEDIVNAQTSSSGFISKRPGYQGFFGSVPIRITTITHDGTDITLTFDSTINIGTIPSTPIVVYGRLGEAKTGDWSNSNNVEYYSNFTVNTRTSLADPPGLLNLSSRAGLDDDVLVTVFNSSSSSLDDNELLIMDSIAVDSTNFDIELGYTGTRTAFVAVSERKDTGVDNFVQLDSVSATSTKVTTISLGTHGLNNSNLILQAYYRVSAPDWLEYIPDSVTIDTSTGEITITTQNASASTNNLKFIITVAPVGNTDTKSVAASSSDTIVISTTDPFHFVNVYTSSGTILTKVIPDSVIFNDTANTLTVSLINATASPLTFVVMFDVASIVSNSLTITDNGATSTTYGPLNGIQMTMWGIPHEGLYLTSGNNEGHVTHIDSYKRESEQRVVSGLGGNIFAARGITESDPASGNIVGTEYAIPSYEVDIDDRVLTTTTLGPGFMTTGGTARTNAQVTSTDIDTSGDAIITAATFVTSGTARYTLSFAAKVGTLAAVLAVGETQFTVTGMANSIHNGTFTVTAVDDTLNTIDVTNAALKIDSFDETGARGRGGVFTDTFSTADGASSPVNVGDKLLNDNNTITVLKQETSNDFTVKDVTTNVDLFAGEVLLVQRVSATIPFTTVANFVKGDTCTFTGIDNKLKILSIDVTNNTVTVDESVTIDFSGTPDILTVEGRWLPIEAPASADDGVVENYLAHLDSKGYHKQDTLRSNTISDNMIFTNNNDEIYKFDGTALYQTGLIKWQPQVGVFKNTISGALIAGETTAAVASSSGVVATLTGLGSSVGFRVGDVVSMANTNDVFTIVSIDDDGTDTLVAVSATLSPGATTMKSTNLYRYYFRLNAIDSNQNIVASASTGSEDFRVRLTATASIQIKLIGLPLFTNYDYDKIELEVYRTKRNTVGPFFRVSVRDLDFNNNSGYITLTDASIDEVLTDFDAVHTALKGSELGVNFAAPPRAKHITSANNALVLGNITDYPELDITLRSLSGIGTITGTDFSGQVFRIKKDTTSASTTTDMINVVNYEFISSGEVTIAPASDIATTTSSFTVTEAGHNLVAGNWVFMFGSTERNLAFYGWHQINAVTSSTFTIKDNTHGRATSGGISTDVNRYIVGSVSANNVPVWLGSDLMFNNLDNRNDVAEELEVIQRLGTAINASMRVTDTTLTSPSQTAFIPWIHSNVGDSIGAGRMLLRQEWDLDTTPSLTLPATGATDAQWFINNVRRADGTEVAATTRLNQSRVIISFPNFPEIFDSPFGDAGDSAVDINSADGQQITGVIPFFGSAAFGASQIEDVVVVFKENSIYLLNITTKEISKIQSRGLGCTAPFSIATTQNGIMFANESGIYKLNRDQSITYVGKNIERLFQDTVDSDNLSKATGHHFGTGQQYKLSVPVGDTQTTNNQVFVYDHQREGKDQEYGAWSRYTNHNSTGWANLAKDAFFATTNGLVYSIRRTGGASDYRDDGDAVAQMEILLRAEDFEQSGSRKIVSNIVSHFSMRRTDNKNTELFVGADLDGTFTSSGTFNFTKGTSKVEFANSSLSRRRLTYVQLKYVNSQKDEDVILAGVSYNVALLNEHGIPEQNN